jgi:hypothetical protein
MWPSSKSARNLVKDARRFGKPHAATADRHLAAVLVRVTKEMASDPTLKRSLKGLL